MRTVRRKHERSNFFLLLLLYLANVIICELIVIVYQTLIYFGKDRKKKALYNRTLFL